MCQLLGITRHGYYSYQKRQRDKPDDPEYQELIGWVKQIAEASQYCYGSRRMKNALNALGYPVGRRRTKSLMKEAKVFVRSLRTMEGRRPRCVVRDRLRFL